ncbi:ankyrin repeat domain-containing protein [Actinomadura geliboluensis]|uniref:ankyrin repeat domain-containing protein n=1 Tax=Actinomadura geliboluensis TaxID=882440 RepID=UPI0036A4A9AE
MRSRTAGQPGKRMRRRSTAAVTAAALAAGADPAVRDGRGRTPLLAAALGDHVEAAKTLVEAGADPTRRACEDPRTLTGAGVFGARQ